jgi:hypothetical protein
MTAARALFTLSVAGALPMIIFGGLVIAIGLLVDELVNFYEGNETIIGQLNEKYPGAIYGAWAALVALGGAFIALKWKAITSMLETMAITAMYAAQSIAAHAAMAVGMLVAYWPILLIIGAIGAVIAAVWYLWKNWGAVTQMMGDAWDAVANAVSDAFAGAMGVIDQVRAKIMGFIEMITGAIGKVGEFLGLTDSNSNVNVAMRSAGTSGASGSTPTNPIGATGGVVGTAGSNSTATSTVTQTTQITGTQIHISSPDPAKAGESVQKVLGRLNRQEIRNGQGQVAL